MDRSVASQVDPQQARRLAAAGLISLSGVTGELGHRFDQAGFELALVGGTVRDALRGQLGEDLDFATNARPEDVMALLRGWADAIWDVGIRFGTVAAAKDSYRIEITTYRAEAYDPASRKPEVAYGRTLDGDLIRRDFTINAMAITLPGLRFVDNHRGLEDLSAGLLRTPGLPAESFDDDPLRMMRAARFAAQFGFALDAQAQAAMNDMADRIAIVSAERVRDELSKLILAPQPRAGLQILTSTGVAARVLPELPALQLEIDEHHRHKDVYEHSLTVLDQAIELEQSHAPQSGPDLVLRLAALLHDIGKPKTRRFEPGGGVSFHHHEVVGAKLAARRLRALRFGNQTVDDVSRLVELHLRFHGYGGGAWTDAAVRRYARDAGPLLVQLHKLTRADCTTRNRRKAAALRNTYDSLEARIAELEEQEELSSMRPDLDGNQIMALLGIGPGRDVGEAYRYLLELRLDRGPLSQQDAERELRDWWSARA